MYDNRLITLDTINQYIKEGTTRKSKEWKATIGTANTGFDIGDDGCPCNDKSN
ncbi:protein of unknown function [Xenorhabdus poinarii G6]|uniref:Uncharacterized protein n=1 Tax=Xenorhabdus poinarii G6 TaxID=1354304 RepID=A0A068R4Z8_9GAMM|nr:protein of unknown function [Xenorhabdus poinarii G6]